MLKKYMGLGIIAVFLFQSFPAFADWDRREDRREGRRWDRGWGHGYVVRRVPPGYRTLIWGGLTYFYCEGLFYRHTPAGYIIADPPVGVIVPSLPSGYTTVMVRETPYYTYGDAYYVTAPNGYAVATPPVVSAPPTVPAPPTVSPAPQVGVTTKTEYKDTIDTYDIYIPNKDGSFTLVTLKKTEKGFLGPQGEFYPEHPTVEQLKALYGKK